MISKRKRIVFILLGIILGAVIGGAILYLITKASLFSLYILIASAVGAVIGGLITEGIVYYLNRKYKQNQSQQSIQVIWTPQPRPVQPESNNSLNERPDSILEIPQQEIDNENENLNQNQSQQSIQVTWAPEFSPVQSESDNSLNERSNSIIEISQQEIHSENENLNQNQIESMIDFNASKFTININISPIPEEKKKEKETINRTGFFSKEKIIKEIKKRINDEEQVNSIYEKIDDCLTCSICFEYSKQNAYLIPCSMAHIIHKRCMDEWIGEDNNRCPFSHDVEIDTEKLKRIDTREYLKYLIRKMTSNENQA